MTQRHSFRTSQGTVEIEIDDRGTVKISNPGCTKVALPFRVVLWGDELEFSREGPRGVFEVEINMPGTFGGPEIIFRDEKGEFFNRPYSLMIEADTGPELVNPVLQIRAQDGIGDWYQAFVFKSPK